MRRLMIACVAAGLIAGPFASGASADPIRDAFCRVADKLGYDWVQDCNLG
jgi:hypothetical protein